MENTNNDLSSKQKGNILEKRFIELVTLGSGGKLSCYSPDSDDDGIDFIVTEKGYFNPLYFQIKGRYNLNNGQYSQDVGCNTFSANEKFFICFFRFNLKDYTIENLWVVPSTELATGTNLLCSATGKKKYRFSASVNDSTNVRWSAFRVEPRLLFQKIQDYIDTLYKGNSTVVDDKAILPE